MSAGEVSGEEMERWRDGEEFLLLNTICIRVEFFVYEMCLKEADDPTIVSWEKFVG